MTRDELDCGVDSRQGQVVGGLAVGEAVEPGGELAAQGGEVEAVGVGRVGFELFHSAAQQGGRSARVLFLEELMEAGGYLDEALVEGFFAFRLLQPDFFQHFVALEELPAIEAVDAPPEGFLLPPGVHERASLSRALRIASLPS